MLILDTNIIICSSKNEFKKLGNLFYNPHIYTRNIDDIKHNKSIRIFNPID
jgi:hypothetical protein